MNKAFQNSNNMKKKTNTYLAPALIVVNFRAERGFAASNMPVLDGNNGDNGNTESFGWQSGFEKGSSSFWD